MTGDGVQAGSVQLRSLSVDVSRKGSASQRQAFQESEHGISPIPDSISFVVFPEG